MKPSQSKNFKIATIFFATASWEHACLDPNSVFQKHGSYCSSGPDRVSLLLCNFITTVVTSTLIAPPVHQPHCRQTELWKYREGWQYTCRVYGSEPSQSCCGCECVQPFWRTRWSCLSELQEQTPFDLGLHFQEFILPRPGTCKDVWSRISGIALVMRTTYWKPAKGLLLGAVETNDGNWMMLLP